MMRTLPRPVQVLTLAVVLATAGTASAAGPSALPGPAAADTVRTNLWLTEALMAEIVASAARALPAPPAAVRLVRADDGPATDLLATVAARVLGGQGYDLFVPEEDPAREGAADVVFTCGVLAVELDYPEVGRTLGIWRRWVQRELAVTASVEVAEAGSGRLLLKERITRSFDDRVPSDDFADVNSGLYDFTSAAAVESNWHRRVEQIVVVGALAGLVAIYFANTRD